jgi:ribokinase
MYAIEYVRQKQRGVWDISKAIERSLAAAAQTMGSLGAQESIPWGNEIR